LQEEANKISLFISGTHRRLGIFSKRSELFNKAMEIIAEYRTTAHVYTIRFCFKI